MEADNFLRVVWVSGCTKRLSVNIQDYGLEKGGKRDFKPVFLVKSLSREALCDSLLLNLAASTARACPRFLAMRDSEQSRIQNEIFHDKACNIKNEVIIQVNQKHTEEK